MERLLRYFHPVLPSRLLGRTRPVGVTIAGRRFALFRDTSGQVGALDDACPHRRAPLSLGRVRSDGRLACPYHGWNFDVQGRGRSPASPELSNCGTQALQAVERFDYVWLGGRDLPIARLPPLGWDGFIFAGTLLATFRAPLELVLDNISEDEHFAFVHSTFGWDEAGAHGVSLRTLRLEDRSEVALEGRQRRSWWAPFGGVHAGDVFRNEWVTRFDPVHAVYTFGWECPRTGRRRPVRTRAAVFLVPEQPELTLAHMFLFLDIAPSLQRLFRPAMHWMARRVAALELRRDAALTSTMTRTPTALRGMRLTRFDEALIHNRSLLAKIYYGEGEAGATRIAG